MSNAAPSAVSAVIGPVAGPPDVTDDRAAGGPGPRGSLTAKRSAVGADAVLGFLTTASGVLILLMMASLVAVLMWAAVPSIRAFGAKFLVDSSWRPNELLIYKVNAAGKHVDAEGNVTHDLTEAVVEKTIPPTFGALPVIYGTAVSSFMALLFAVPLSLGAALFLVRIAPRVRAVVPGTGVRLPVMGVVSFLIEFLAAIPSIAYGVWGMFVLKPLLQDHVEPPLNRFFGWCPGFHWLHHEGATTGSDMLCGGLILGIMVLPIITAISRDVLKSVPRVQIEGTQALGATWWQSSKEMLRYSRSGLFGAIMLGLARAAGETMAVTMVIGNVTEIHASPFAAAQTMSSLLASKFHEAEGAMEGPALLEVALILLAMSLLFNVVARYLVVGKQSRSAAAH